MDRNDSRVDFCDVRELNTNLCDGRKLVVDPDYIADVTDLPQKDETYYLVVFDPPHLNTIGETSWMCKKYGRLPQDWKEFMRKAFSECWTCFPEGRLLKAMRKSDLRGTRAHSRKQEAASDRRLNNPSDTFFQPGHKESVRSVNMGQQLKHASLCKGKSVRNEVAVVVQEGADLILVFLQ